jgi:hypothetical protein
MRPDVAFSYVRDLSERMTGVRPEPDHDGDLPVHFHGAQFFVRVVARRPTPGCRCSAWPSPTSSRPRD